MTILSTTTRTGRRRTLAVAVCLAATLAACGGGDDGGVAADDTTTTAADDAGAGSSATDDDTSATDDDTSAADGEESSAAPAGDTGAPVTTAETDLGTILVTADGMTIYGFTQDEQGGGSACTEGCLETWPPVLLDDETLPEGLDADVFGVLVRDDDGSAQLTADGWPLYTYAPDQTPGDTTGQGVGDVWWVVGPDGSLIMDDAGQAAGSLGW